MIRIWCVLEAHQNVYLLNNGVILDDRIMGNRKDDAFVTELMSERKSVP